MNLKFRYQSLAIEYNVFGKGADSILCFHGFGRKLEDFELFVPLLKEDQQLVAINLFAHQESYFPKERIDTQPLLEKEWTDLLNAFCKELNIEKFHLLGYSMGGRVCLKTIELMPERIKSVLLMATDGLKINMLYRFASGTILGKWIYRKLIDNPKPLFRIADFLHWIKILHPKLHRFTYVHLDTREKRMQVHDTWLIYKNFFPNLKNTAAIIRRDQLPFHMIFGQYDSVIRPKLGVRFCRILGSENYMSTIPSGHRLLTEQLLVFIQEKNLWPS